MDARVTDYTGNRHPGQIPTRITIIFSNGSGSPGGLPAWMAVSKERGDLKTHSAHADVHVHTQYTHARAILLASFVLDGTFFKIG